MERLKSGKEKIIFRNISCIVIIGLTKSGRAAWQEEEEKREEFIIVLIHQDQFVISELFKVIQDAISLILHYRTMSLIPNDFFEYIYQVGCAINLHSITISGLIPGGQHLSKRQTLFFTSVDAMNKEHRDPNKIDLEAPRLAWYKQKKVEVTPKHGVLGRHETWSTERI